MGIGLGFRCLGFSSRGVQGVRIQLGGFGSRYRLHAIPKPRNLQEHSKKTPKHGCLLGCCLVFFLSLKKLNYLRT